MTPLNLASLQPAPVPQHHQPPKEESKGSSFDNSSLHSSLDAFEFVARHCNFAEEEPLPPLEQDEEEDAGQVEDIEEEDNGPAHREISRHSTPTKKVDHLQPVSPNTVSSLDSLDEFRD